MITKKIFIPVILVSAIAGSAIFGRNLVKAQSKGNYLSGLVQAIAQKFNLDQNQVQTVVDDYKKTQVTQMQQQWQQTETDRLSKLVTEGKITEAQKQAILTEMAALKAKYNQENLKNLSADQRKTQMQAEKDEITAWAKTNGIDQTYLMYGRMGGLGRGFGRKVMQQK